MEQLPIYKLVIDEDDDNSGVDFVALVDEPAIERNWIAFNKDKKQFKADTERRIISGPLMVSNLLIYRRNEQFGEFYVKFDRETIRKIVHKYFRNGFTANVNLMHETGKIDGVFMFESFLIDSKRGINTPEGFGKLPDGSWFGSFKVDNDEIWNDFVKTGEFKGFSVEGIFEQEFIQDTDQQVIDRLIEVIQQIDS